MSKSTFPKEAELHPDAWERFEHAINTVSKTPPQHRKASEKMKKRHNKPQTRG